MMIVNPAPALKPTKILSLTSLTSMLSRSNHAIKQSKATVKAARLAIWAYRCASPSAIAPTVPATIKEMADVGPTASWRDEPSSA